MSAICIDADLPASFHKCLGIAILVINPYRECALCDNYAASMVAGRAQQALLECAKGGI